MQEKRCPFCQINKSSDDFYLRKPKKIGHKPSLDSYCKKCRNARSMSYVKENYSSDQRREYLRKWREENLDRAREFTRLAERRRRAKRKGEPVTDERRAQEKEYRRQLRIRNIEKALAKEHKARAKRRQAEGNFTGEQWKSLCQQFGNICLCCREQKPLTVDHVVPISKGGTNDISNLQPLCFSCNSSKGAKEIDYRPVR